MPLIKINLDNTINIRRALVASEGYYILSCDYSQVEYRLMASLSGEQSLIDDYRSGIDFHTRAASLFLTKPIDKITPADRKKGKTLNFGLIYGMSTYGLAQRLGMSKDKAEEMFNLYFSRLPKMKEFKDLISRQVMSTGEVRTYYGRRRKFKDYKSEDQKIRSSIKRQAFNTIIQGTAADLNKLGMVRVYQGLQKDKILNKSCRLLSTVHDELNAEFKNDVPLKEAVDFMDKHMTLHIKDEWTDFPIDAEYGSSLGTLQEFDIERDFQPIVAKAKENKKPEVMPPAIVLKIIDKESFNSYEMNRLKEVVNKNYGDYTVYFDIEGSLKMSSFKTNGKTLYNVIGMEYKGILEATVHEGGNFVLDFKL